MEDFKGTKETWLIENRNGDQYFYIVNKTFQQHFIGRMFYLGEDRINEHQYNALLISKAPEMLAFLIKIKKEWEDDDLKYGGENFHMNEITELIKEATQL